jgi:anaerobic magnesium-protoporphyrin IX monomethyl ester cyclase
LHFSDDNKTSESKVGFKIDVKAFTYTAFYLCLAVNTLVNYLLDLSELQGQSIMIGSYPNQRIMNICLIRPPRFLDKEAINITNTPALGLAFIAGALKQAGHTVSVIDAIGESPKEFNPIGFELKVSATLPPNRIFTNGLSASEIADRIPASVDVIGISAMFSNNWLFDRYLIDFLGERFPTAVIVAGGESVTAMAEMAISQTKSLEACVLGEGEETIVELVAALEKKEPLGQVKGIAYREPATGKAIFTERRTRMKNMDEIAMPAWEYFPMDNYEKYDIKWGVTRQKSIPIMATRGCPYSCTFCSSPQMWGTRYYMRNPQSVVDEMEYLKATYGATNFDFYDLTAIIKKDWIILFTNEIINRNLNITWQLPVGTRSEVIDQEVAHNLYASGCRHIVYAPESGSPKMLKLIKKKVKISNMLQSMGYSHKENMFVYINMIMAMPDETHADVWRTIWFLIQCSWMGVNDISPSVFQPYPGSMLFERLVKEKKIDLSTDDFFFELIFIDSFGKSKYYNDLVSTGWYNFYELFSVFLFFGTNYLFRPIRFFRTVRNLITRNYENRAERSLVEYLKQKSEKLSFKPKSLEPQV